MGYVSDHYSKQDHTDNKKEALVFISNSTTVLTNKLTYILFYFAQDARSVNQTTELL